MNYYTPTCFDTIRVIFRELVFITSSLHKYINFTAVIYKLLPSYMFRHYRVILRELVLITSPSYISTSIAELQLMYLCNLAR